MGIPVFKLIYDRRGRASRTKEGAIELRITYNRIQKHATTGVRVLPNQWKNGFIVNRLDALELQQSLDAFVAKARQIVNEQMEAGTLDMQTIVSVIGGKQKRQAAENLPDRGLLIDFFRERTMIRQYGRAEDSQERYERFLRWFERWGGMVTWQDVTEANIIRMDEALGDKMKPCSKWGNYHRFLNGFIIDAINEGIIRKNPYKSLHIKKDKNSDEALEKYLTREEFARLVELELPSEYLRHARDLFVFQTYTCMAYVDLAAFDAAKIVDVKGRPMYVGRRGKTNQKFTFLVLPQAQEILDRYDGRLPMMSNQKYNQYVKMIAVMAGINKPVSSHWARHTGATLLLNSGVDMEVVSKVLGHSSTRMTRMIYAKMLDETIANAMEKMVV
ncbi:MAG: tyrosine-type recombinase/integrase [Bacteroidales bacterium]|nr:tyrosine-type recombinase/integrase [Bacteroidales bacterium]